MTILLGACHEVMGGDNSRAARMGAIPEVRGVPPILGNSRLDAAAGLAHKARMAKLPANLGVMILGAGASSRMGRPKLLLPWGETTVIGQIISVWHQLGAEQIVVVMRENDSLFAAELDRLRFSVVNRIVNPQPERGMFSSILCAANWPGWENQITHWAVVLGDQPHLATDTLRALLECSAQNPQAICQPALGGREKHPVILPTRAMMALKKAASIDLKEFLKLADCPRVQCPVNDSGLSLDLDTPEDYKRLTVFR